MFNQYTQTLPLQFTNDYFHMPLEYMAKTLEGTQKIQDENEAAAKSLNDIKWNWIQESPDDTAASKNIRQGINSKVDELLSGYKNTGDLRFMQGDIKQYAKDLYRRTIQGGDIYQLQSNYETRNKWREEINKNEKILPEEKRRVFDLMDLSYIKQGGIGKDSNNYNSYATYNLQNYVDLNKLAEEAAKGYFEHKWGAENIKHTADGLWWAKTGDKWEEIKKEDVKQGVKSALVTNSEAVGYLKQRGLLFGEDPNQMVEALAERTSSKYSGKNHWGTKDLILDSYAHSGYVKDLNAAYYVTPSVAKDVTYDYKSIDKDINAQHTALLNIDQELEKVRTARKDLGTNISSTDKLKYEIEENRLLKQKANVADRLAVLKRVDDNLNAGIDWTPEKYMSTKDLPTLAQAYELKPNGMRSETPAPNARLNKKYLSEYIKSVGVDSASENGFNDWVWEKQKSDGFLLTADNKKVALFSQHTGERKSMFSSDLANQVDFGTGMFSDGYFENMRDAKKDAFEAAKKNNKIKLESTIQTMTGSENTKLHGFLGNLATQVKNGQVSMMFTSGELAGKEANSENVKKMFNNPDNDIQIGLVANPNSSKPEFAITVRNANPKAGSKDKKTYTFQLNDAPGMDAEILNIGRELRKVAASPKSDMAPEKALMDKNQADLLIGYSTAAPNGKSFGQQLSENNVMGMPENGISSVIETPVKDMPMIIVQKLGGEYIINVPGTNGSGASPIKDKDGKVKTFATEQDITRFIGSQIQ